MYKVSFNQEVCYTNRKLVFIVGLLYISCNGDALSPKVTWIKVVNSKSQSNWICYSLLRTCKLTVWSDSHV